MDANVKQKTGLFSNLKITHKLAMIMVFLLLGFGVIGGGYWFQQIKMKEVAATEKTALRMEILDAHTSHDILMAQNALTEFMLTNNDKLIQAYFDSMEKAKGSADELSQLVNANDQQIIQEVHEAIGAYQVAGDELVTTQLQIGLTQDIGLRGAVRKAVHQLENFIKTALAEAQSSGSSRSKANAKALIFAKMETSMLTMRRHEKDFIEREDMKYGGRLAQQAETFLGLLQKSALTDDVKKQMAELLALYQDNFNKLVKAVTARKQVLSQLDEMQLQMDAQLSLLGEHVKEIFKGVYERAEALTVQTNTLFIGTMGTVAILALMAIVSFSTSIRRSMTKLRQKVVEIAQGDTKVAELLDSGEEFNALGVAFDALLTLRQAESEQLEKENDQINNSVIELMDATDRLSKRDLTVVAPVSEDITGNVSDALNMMTRETARIMLDINKLAGQLEAAAGVVRQQGDKVADVAASERQVVAQALAKLEESATTMAEMAELAVSCDELGGNAAQSTKQALLTVRNTVRNINEIRNSVGETEKSIKRLGERSQEIGGIVEIIKDISERTHTLALNAGMQAVAAGEAGRGFSVVADEVQRLAETARESTDQIAALVQSIQAEASETMTIMNKTVSQVVEGSELAEKAGKRMRRTQRTTEDLVTAVEKIAERSKAQVSINDDLRASAGELEQSTEATEHELREQTMQTENLFKYLSALVKSVRVFKLPDAA